MHPLVWRHSIQSTCTHNASLLALRLNQMLRCKTGFILLLLKMSGSNVCGTSSPQVFGRVGDHLHDPDWSSIIPYLLASVSHTRCVYHIWKTQISQNLKWVMLPFICVACHSQSVCQIWSLASSILKIAKGSQNLHHKICIYLIVNFTQYNCMFGWNTTFYIL